MAIDAAMSVALADKFTPAMQTLLWGSAVRQGGLQHSQLGRKRFDIFGSHCFRRSFAVRRTSPAVMNAAWID